MPVIVPDKRYVTDVVLISTEHFMPLCSNELPVVFTSVLASNPAGYIVPVSSTTPPPPVVDTYSIDVFVSGTYPRSCKTEKVCGDPVVTVMG